MGLDQAATAVGVPHRVQRVGSMFTLFFTDTPVTDYETAKTSDTAKFAKFFWGLMDRGVYWPCSQFEAAFLSAAHTEADVNHTIAAARGVGGIALSRLRRSNPCYAASGVNRFPPQTMSKSP